MESLSKVPYNIIRIFIDFFKYLIHDSDTVGNDWVKVTNENFNEFHITCYDDFRSLDNAVIVNPSSNETTLPYRSYYPVENFKTTIKRYPSTTGFNMVK